MSLKAIIRSVGPKELDVKLKKYIEKHHFSKWGEILPAAMESIVKNEQSGAKINLIFSSIDPSDTALMNTIPGKVFELIRLKQPVLAIADNNSEISKILNQTHKGIASSNKKEIAYFLYEDHIKYEGINKEADFFSRRNQAIILCEFLDEVLDGENIVKKPIFDGLSTLGGTITSRAASGVLLNNMIAEKQKEKEKFRIMYQLMEKWMKLKQEGKTLELYFKLNNYKKIAIYGMGDIGNLLLKELRGTSVTVVYGIDKNKDALADIIIISPNNELQQVDAIVVTAIACFGEVDEMLSKKVNYPIISLEDIVYELV